MGNFKRNDKVTVFIRTRLHPKFSDTTYLIPGKRYVIKAIFAPDSMNDQWWARIYGPTERKRDGGEWMAIELKDLYYYTRLGELLYG